METNLIPIADIERMGKAIAESNLFGMKTPAQAVALMLIAQAEGLHPAIAARDYHIINGRPALKADTMLARFQSVGGSVKWEKYDDTECIGIFTHPQGGTVRIVWNIEMAKNAGLTAKDVWKNYPRAMLRARVVSEGIRTVYPGVIAGTYTPEEIGDMPQEPAREINTEEVAAVTAKPPERIPSDEVRTDMLTCAGTIEDVTIKNGEKNGKPWTRFGITINGKTFGTFDKKIGEAALLLKGKEGHVGYVQEDKYFTALEVSDLPF